MASEISRINFYFVILFYYLYNICIVMLLYIERLLNK